MSMNVGESSSGGMMATINTTPLVDVMLVLLIIFLITIPVITKTVPLTLPKAVNIPTQTKPENITIAVDREGGIYWNEKKMANKEVLLGYIKEAAVRVPQPEIHIRADQDTRYESVGKVVATCQRAAILKIGFITEPPARVASGG